MAFKSFIEQMRVSSSETPIAVYAFAVAKQRIYNLHVASLHQGMAAADSLLGP